MVTRVGVEGGKVGRKVGKRKKVGRSMGEGF